VIEIVKAPPFATIQDFGFPRGRAWGLPTGGAMDPRLLSLANTLVGNPPGAAAIEWTSGTGVLRCALETRIAVLGLAEILVEGVALDPPELVFPVPAGSTVSLTPRLEHRYSYVAVAGGIAVPEVLGSRSTYLAGEIGGQEGRRLRAGDRLEIGTRPSGWSQAFELIVGEVREHLSPEDCVLRVTRGPQWDRFERSARDGFLGGRYTVGPSSDRLGYRLVGPTIRPREKATLPSEAACPGAIQIPDGGQPIVLMPDGPTVGGYPKLAVVVRADLRKLAQCQPGAGVRFREVSLEEARACYSEVR
jgi:biotin-dependent carboxylase-like uncharacterized protein